MARFIVLTRLNASGLAAFRDQADHRPDIAAEVTALGGKFVEQYAMIGDYNMCTVVDLPDNTAAQLLSVPTVAPETASRLILPAIDQQLFIRLLGQTTETVGPHRWQISLPARIGRRLLRNQFFVNDLKQWCRPFKVLGGEHFENLTEPVLVISNHSSHLDQNALFGALPPRYQRRIAWGAAADRWFLKGRRGYKNQAWYRSLAMNAFPIKRGGGRASLAYAEWLISKGWSVMLFPEGTRSTTGRMSKFRVGPALVAIATGVPVMPVYMEGLREIRPKGSKLMTAGPVTVQIGAPLRFGPDADPGEAAHAMYKAMEELRLMVRKPVRTRYNADAEDLALSSAES
jgi:1-acyl-sn-glycerol-3-phosphate acyltransferase